MNDLNIESAFDEPVKYSKGQVLFVEGASTSYMYMLISGKVGVFSETEGGRYFLVDVVEDQGLLGEDSMFNDGTLGTSAIALEETSLYMIKKSDLRKIVSQCPEWVTDIMVTLCDRLKNATHELREHKVASDLDSKSSLEEGVVRNAIEDFRKKRNI